eukprot:gene20900-26543_t
MVGISVNDTTMGTLVANLGMTAVRFPKPVFHGDTLRVRTTIKSMRESKSRVTAGIVEFEHTALNQNDEVVAVCLRQALMLKKAQSAELATSFLFVPANRPDRFDKAANSGADAIILDLEDSVPAQEKQLARDAVLQWMRTPRIGISVWIRVNPLQSQGLLADLRTAVAAKPHGIVLPKCEGADD